MKRRIIKKESFKNKLSQIAILPSILFTVAILTTSPLILSLTTAEATHDSYASVSTGQLTGSFYCPPMDQPPFMAGNFNGRGSFGASTNPDLDDADEDGSQDYGLVGFDSNPNFNQPIFPFIGDEIDDVPTISSSAFKLTGTIDPNTEGTHCGPAGTTTGTSFSYTIEGPCSTDGSPVTVEVEVSSGGHGSFTGVVECHVAAGNQPPPTNQPPTATNDHYKVLEDTTLEIAAPGILQNDNDPDGNPLKAIKVSDPANGVLELGEDGSFAYTPTSNFHGVDSFKYKSNDGNADSNEATVEIVVDPANDPPTANDDEASTDEDTPVTVDVLANDADPDGDSVTVSSVSTQPSSGRATINQDNTITYSPNDNFNGQDSFTYQVTDSNGGSDSAAVTLTVNPVADTPNKPTITSPQDGTTTNDNTPSIEGTADGTAATTIEVFADGISLGTSTVDSDSGSWSFTPSSSLSDGTHDITATATNDEEEEGATSEPSDPVTVTIDTKAPTVTGIADREPDSNGYYTEPITVTWQGDDGGSDGSGIDSCDEPTTYSGPDGTSIELTGECTDNAGNTGQGTFTLDYDATGPEVTITKAEDQNDDVANGGTTKSNQIEFRFTASDSGSGLQSVECSLDGGSFSDCTSPVEYTKLKKGTHTFEVRATDQVGNVGTDDFSWRIN